jgi:hypothetical protein
VLGIVGALPSEAYEVTITSDRAGLGRLMHSSLCTGYALRNAEFRLALNDALNDALAPGCGKAETAGVVAAGKGKAPASKRGRPSKKPPAAATSAGPGGGGEPDYMRKVPARGGPRDVDSSQVAGRVQWWDADLERRLEMGGAEYVAKLESENELLRDRLAASAAHGEHASNRILEFMKSLSRDKITSLQREVSPLSEDAFRRVLTSVLGELNGEKVQTTFSTSRDYLAQITWWCLLSGYTMRNLEKKDEMTVLFANTESLDSSVTASSPSSSAQPPPLDSSPPPPPPPPPSA